MAQAMTQQGFLPSSDHEDLLSARRTLATEIEGLRALSQSLNGEFISAITVIQTMKDKGRGRLIVPVLAKAGMLHEKLLQLWLRQPHRPIIFTRVKPVMAIWV